MQNKVELFFFLPSSAILIGCLLISPLILENALGLNCWECDGVATPLCETLRHHDHHEGKSRPCPSPSQTYPYGYNESSNFSCLIMKTVAHATDKIEITKGCVLNEGDYFVINTFDKIYLENGECYNHSDVGITDRRVYTHDVTICICGEDDCNKKNINGIGEEDIKQRLGKGTAGAPKRFSTTLSSILLIAMIVLDNALQKMLCLAGGTSIIE